MQTDLNPQSLALKFRGYLQEIPLSVVALFALLIVVSLAPWLDSKAEEYIDTALFNSGAIYATARGINALVSVLQTTQVSVFFVSLDIGEVLDPVNDLIERFSDVISIALASLALQKILLLISSHGIFKVLLLLSAILFMAASAFKKILLRDLSFKVLISLIFIRLAFALVIIANTGVDQLFLHQQSEHSYQGMQTYQKQLNNVANLVKDGNEANQQQQQDLQQQIETISQQRARLNSRQASLQTRIELQNQKIRDRRNQLGTISRFYSEDAELNALYQDMNALQIQEAELKSQTNRLDSHLGETEEQLQCLQKKARGESCGVGDWFGSATSGLDLKQKVIALSENIEQFVDSTLQLLTLLLLKSILLPLLFWWMLYRIFKSIWGLELPTFKETAKKP
ncbi:hypothetical protein [Thiomicrorhabdus heinhorstiae]|uniref:Uncharacterized protein n=1 Tax=Thiomicrorhabdus heinhorstiae TaxID=2748010 RepID=A0ABS0BUM7_9GAMM|nr:hypothetical protein [Thiomicrorhabdus heinhorstiae]MBF6057475.1 hypothetical protein [Thiomicrorhabdus heinhorstiae]